MMSDALYKSLQQLWRPHSPLSSSFSSSRMRFPSTRPASWGYEVLPSNNSNNNGKSSNPSPLHRIARRITCRRAALLALVALPLLAWLICRSYPEQVENMMLRMKGKIPPTYERFYELERAYPQHDESLPWPEGENGRYLWVSNQHWGEHSTSLIVFFLAGLCSRKRSWVEQHLPTIVRTSLDVPRRKPI